MDKGVEQIWQIFKEAFLSMQELSIPKSGNEGKRPAWPNQEQTAQTEEQEEKAQAVETETGSVGRI